MIASGKVKDIGKKISLALKKYRKKQLKPHLEDLIELSKINKNRFRKIVYSKGQRGELPLTRIQKERISEYAQKYDYNAEKIEFKDTVSDHETGYSFMFGLDRLVINSDIMPGKLGDANSRLSWKAGKLQ